MKLCYALVAVAVCALPGIALADGVFVVKPAGKRVAAEQLDEANKSISEALATRDDAKMIDHAITAACAVKASCLAKVGAAESATRVVGVQLTKHGAKVGVVVTVVDVGGGKVVKTTKRTLGAKQMSDVGGVVVESLEGAKPSLDQQQTTDAKKLFDQGNEYYKLGDYAKALEAYREAYRLKPLPAFLFNIGQCLRKTGDYQQAINMYQSYLTEVPNAPAEKRELVESLITESQQLLASEQNRKQAELDAERKRAEAERLARQEERRAREAEARAEAERRQAEIERRKREERYNQHPMRRWTYVGAGVGLAAIGGGVTFGLLANAAQDDFDERGCGDPAVLLTMTDINACLDDKDKAESDTLLGRVFVGAGAAIVAASVVVYLLDPGNIDPPEQQGLSLQIGPGSIQATYRF